LAICATTGAPPVPVPPPMPAVMNTMSAPPSTSADALAVLDCRLAADFGVGARAQALGDVAAQLQQGSRLQRLSACASVLAQMNSTPSTCR
jgi:hypothetical protein